MLIRIPPSALALFAVLAGSATAQVLPGPPRSTDCTARVRVLDLNGGPVHAFELTLLRCFPQRPLAFGKVQQFEDRTLGFRDFDSDFARLEGLPAGRFVFQVKAELHAMTRSEPFEVTPDSPAPEVTVKLTRGGTLAGTVHDDQGKPLARARVSTETGLPFAADTPFAKVLEQLAAQVITATSVETDQEGRFRLPLLAFGEYRVRVVHTDYCDLLTAGVIVADGTPVKLPVLAVERGSVVEGSATLDGAVREGIVITIDREPAGGAGPGVNTVATALTDAKGAFRFARPLPAGHYQVHASCATDPQNVFAHLLQIGATRRALVIGKGQGKATLEFAVKSQ